MKDKILVLGQSESSRHFTEMCKKEGIEIGLLKSAAEADSCFEKFGIVVEFQDGKTEIAAVAPIDYLEKTQLWLSESVDKSVTEMACMFNKSERFIGFSLSGLYPEKKFVELIAGELTEDDALSAAKELFERMQFTVVVSQDRAGHVVDRVVASMINEAVYVNMYGLAKMEDIDQMMRLGANFPMGPFEYADFLGLDRVLKTLEWLTEELGSQYRPCPLLKRKVEAGFLGRKTKRGFYIYQ